MVDYKALQKITQGGVVSTVVGSPRVCGDQAGMGASALLCYPSGVAVDTGNNFYAIGLQLTLWLIDSGGTMNALGKIAGCAASITALGAALFVGDGCSGQILKIQGGTSSPFVTVTPRFPSHYKLMA